MTKLLQALRRNPDAIALAVLWMSKEVERARRIHDLNSPAAPAKQKDSNFGNHGTVPRILTGSLWRLCRCFHKPAGADLWYTRRKVAGWRLFHNL